jgi:hypothetical protein
MDIRKKEEIKDLLTGFGILFTGILCIVAALYNYGKFWYIPLLLLGFLVGVYGLAFALAGLSRNHGH